MAEDDELVALFSNHIVSAFTLKSRSLSIEVIIIASSLSVSLLFKSHCFCFHDEVSFFVHSSQIASSLSVFLLFSFVFSSLDFSPNT